MKAFRGQPSIFASTQSVDRRAELEVKKIFLNFGGVMVLPFSVAFGASLIAIIATKKAFSIKKYL